ncbi:plastocyanin/azurin family copper-binding protein [Halorussus halophilus]|uniref:plastocyanin/azurin family copper-binding protein n=1 Tax=Halorussus halophilus TaxID=2650975 RepID=UPI0013012082|nr:plastocyanin/azurin family copper-binding protein [Halorussus halophilus]
MRESESTRRRFLAGTGVAVTVGIAGCSTSTPQQNSTTGSLDENESSGSGESTTNHSDSHDDESGKHGSSLDGPRGDANVTMKTTDSGSHFEPHVVWVEQGATVTWKLQSGSHSTTAYASNADKPQRVPKGASAWDSGTLSEQGKTFEHTFETEGVYDYFCIPHEATGMVGTVIVGNPDPEEQLALKPPQDSFSDATAKKLESLNTKVSEALGHSDGSSGSGNHSETTDGHSH